MQTLPLYIKLDIQHYSNVPIIISHAPIGNVWHIKDIKSSYQVFKESVLWNKSQNIKNQNIFNIFGHIPSLAGVNVNKYYVNVDTGCYLNKHNKLSAYCVETGEVLSVTNHDWKDNQLKTDLYF